MKLANNLTLDNILASVKSSYKQKFSKQQIKELIEGYKEGAEIRAYADPSISDLIMCSLRYSLLEFGNPNNYEDFRKRIVKYIKDGYYKGQVTELANGLLTGVNVSLYEDLSLNRFAMSIIRKNLERGVDVSSYTRESFYVSQVEEIAEGLYLGLDVSCYANKDFTSQQMRLIRLGLEEGLDAQQYADPTLSDYEMNCRLDELRHPIIIGERLHMKLTTNLTVENLLKNEKWTSQFDTLQLNMIQSGLQQGYDVSIYATPDLDVYQMRVILYCLYYEYDELARNLSKTPNFNPDAMMSYLKFLLNSSHGAQYK